MIDERWATYLPASVSVQPAMTPKTETPNLLAVARLAQASDLRHGLAQLARDAVTHEERVGLEQACKAVDYAIRQLRG